MMFMYTHKQTILKAIAKELNVKKFSKFKVRAIQASEVEGLGIVYGFYNVKTNEICINNDTWSVLTDYEKFDLLVHEIIHLYQHTYDLCEFTYIEVQEERPQEVHAECHTQCILDKLVEQGVVRQEDSAIELLFI